MFDKVSAKAGLVVAGMALFIGSASAADWSIAAKSGESVDLFPVWGVANCRSMLTAKPEVEVLQDVPGVILSVREEDVKPTKLNCPNKVKGGVVVATIGQIEKPIEGEVVFRVLFQGKQGKHQAGHKLKVALFPAPAPKSQ
ncbi:hypothetical protein [Rhodomicrobium sp.]|uniref:hypothetical protein n=1 Tax=Rhodomicrobium sp. TaxID=2720632 RepID=UPI0039E4A3E8